MKTNKYNNNIILFYLFTFKIFLGLILKKLLFVD